MPVYRLTPLEGSETSPQWQASSMRPYCLWVRAKDELDARRQVAKATAVTGDAEVAPWKDEGLVACEYDDSKELADGIIYVRRAMPQRERCHA
ncbi:hypothetical protein FHS83_002928 [Rhizomicrobium palustre]|uniref:Uncharacterized protein n=1 Tax=Rhizomicrobium palustre TaxID=189966 RepID=A0A846N3F8_9PROT|nr:hypothetical protein [Rhizomicrobium palustre]NIK89610.1 hypothetical protein [Rhizomicrobium palustre]